MTIWAIVPASGTGQRMGSATPKQYLKFSGKTVLEHSLDRLLEIPDIATITVVTSSQDQWWETLAVASHPRIVRQEGAALRHRSVFNGVSSLQGIAQPNDWVLVHDAARPCVRVSDVSKLIVELAAHDAGGLLGIPVSNTLKKLDGNMLVRDTVDRTDLWQALTPQLFRFSVLFRALQTASENNITVTDEASAVELLGHKPQLVEGSSDNIKITHAMDLLLAQQIIESQAIKK